MQTRLIANLLFRPSKLTLGSTGLDLLCLLGYCSTFGIWSTLVSSYSHTADTQTRTQRPLYRIEASTCYLSEFPYLSIDYRFLLTTTIIFYALLYCLDFGPRDSESYSLNLFFVQQKIQILFILLQLLLSDQLDQPNYLDLLVQDGLSTGYRKVNAC